MGQLQKEEKIVDKVTILMSTYNRADFFLPRAIKSVLNQTYQNWELIINDDGSTDNTPEVVSGFNDNRIIHLRSEVNTKGESIVGFLNKYIKESKSEFISFLDDDCMYYPTNLEKKINEIKKGYVAVYGYAMDVLYPTEKNHVPCGAGKRGKPFDMNMYMFGGTYFNYIGMSDILGYREKIVSVGQFKEGAKYQDYVLISKLCMRYENGIGCVPEVLTEYAINVERLGVSVNKDTGLRNSDSLMDHINIY